MPRRSTSGLTMKEVTCPLRSMETEARIPDELWTAASELARKRELNRVSRVLRVEFNHLKRMAESGGQTTSRRVEKAPGPTQARFAPNAAAALPVAPDSVLRNRLRKRPVDREQKSS